MTYQEGFKKRVNFAANYISAGRKTTRTFDSCFENYDGDAVATALVRRAQAKPNGKLAKNLWRYISKETVEPVVAKYTHIPTKSLPYLAEGIALGKAMSFAAFMASRK